jgi:tuberculosinol/isotuberculosinol synthase
VDPERFRNLTTAEVAQHMHAAGPKTCAFPINGTRRWFLLEHTSQGEDLVSSYLDISVRRHIELYRVLFDHGLDTLLAPIFGPDLMERGEDYMQMAAEGLARLATAPEFLDFYRTYGVRVRFYGDYRKFFAPTAYTYLSDLFDEATAKTASHDRHRLFFGVCAQDATETIAELAVQYHTQHGHVPDKRTLVSLYYGEHIPPVDFFIGFDKFCSFDMPLVATGNEDLYFTVSPSPYLTEDQLRDILYDHLYTRRADETDYLDMTPEDWDLMRTFYHANRDRTLGVGARQQRGGYWYPLPTVQLPEGFEEMRSS